MSCAVNIDVLVYASHVPKFSTYVFPLQRTTTTAIILKERKLSILDKKSSISEYKKYTHVDFLLRRCHTKNSGTYANMEERLR